MKARDFKALLPSWSLGARIASARPFLFLRRDLRLWADYYAFLKLVKQYQIKQFLRPTEKPFLKEIDLIVVFTTIHLSRTGLFCQYRAKHPLHIPNSRRLNSWQVFCFIPSEGVTHAPLIENLLRRLKTNP